MKKRIISITMASTLIFNLTSSAISMTVYADKENTNQSTSYFNNDYKDRYIEYNEISIRQKIEKAMIYNDKAYARIIGKGLPYQYICIDENGETLIPEINSKIMRIFDDKNGILAEIDDFNAAYEKQYGRNEHYKYDINTKEISKIIPDEEGYNEFLDILKENGYSLRSTPTGYNELNPTWVGFQCYSSTEYNSIGFYNRKTKQLITYKDYGFDKIELIKAYGDKAFFTYKNNHSDIDTSNDESYIVMAENGQFTKIGDIDIEKTIQDISEDGKCIVDKDRGLYAINNTGGSYRYIGSDGSISGDDVWFKSSYPYYTINYYDKSTNETQVMYKDKGSNNMVSKGRNNVFGFYTDFTGERGEYFRVKHTEVDRPTINSVTISPDKIYMGYPYKISVDATEGALIKYVVSKDGTSKDYSYSDKKEIITEAANRNSVTVYVKNKDSKYNYDEKYVVDQFIGSHTYYPIYTFDKNKGTISGYSGQPVKIVVKGNDRTLIQEYIATPDELGNFNVKLAYPLKGGERLEISYENSSMKQDEYVSLPSDYKISTTTITTADDTINGLLKEWNGNGKVVAQVNGEEIGSSIPNPYNFNINLSKRLSKGDIVDIISYDSKNQENARETLEVYEDSLPQINLKQDNITILETEVDKYNFKALATASDRENGDITKKIGIKENTVESKPGNYKVVYSVSDYKKQTVEKEIQITVKSNNKPTITGIVNNTIKAGDEFDPRDKITANDIEDGDLTSKISIDGVVNTNEVGIYNLTYFVSDSDGNTTSANREITVRSNEKPVINAQDSSMKVGDEFDPMKNVTATDKEDKDITSKVTIKENTVNTNVPGIYKVIYEVTDSDENTIIKEIKVTVNPKLSIMNKVPNIIAKNVQIKEGDEFNPLADVVAEDEEDGDITDKIEVVSNNVDTSKKGIYNVTYKVADKQGATKSITITVNVRSNRLPVIHANDIAIEYGEEFNPRDYIRVTDEEDGDITDNLEIQGEVDSLVSGSHIIKCKVTDSDGNTVEKEVKITVKDAHNNIPIIYAENKTIPFGSDFDPLAGVSAYDEEDGDITDKIEIVENTVDTQRPGTYRIEYSVTDSKGLMGMKAIYITVEEVKNGWIYEENNWYFYNEQGQRHTGWLNLNGTWYYLKDDGKMAKGWEKVGDKWYYLQNSGAMKIGWLDLSGTWYYLRSNGQMAIGWEKVGDKWYYLENSGAMKIGWLDLNGTWYYLKSNGQMAIGWEKVGDKWYYLENSGAMKKGWLNLSGEWYYLRSNGEMAIGWEKIGGKWYYLYSSGKMAKNTTIDGWKIDSNGVGTPKK